MQVLLHRSDLVVRLLDGTERAAAARGWQAVEARADQVALAASWIWTETWLQHYGDAVPHRFVVIEDEHGPCGAALLGRVRRMRGPVPVRQLHVGTSGEPPGSSVCVEHNPVLSASGRAGVVAEAVAEAVLADRSWDELVVEGSPDANIAIAVARRTWRGRLRTVPQTALHHDLQAINADGDLADGLARGPRRRLRASLRAFAARGALTLDWPTDADGALAVLDELVALHQRRWTAVGEPGSFSSAPFLAFHRDLVAQLVPQGQAAVVRVRCGPETVACLYGQIDGDALRFYQSGVASYADNRLRPGLVAHAIFMDACRERGLRLYDFLAGDHRYKRELATGGTDLFWCTVQRPRLRLRALNAVRSLRDRARAED